MSDAPAAPRSKIPRILGWALFILVVVYFIIGPIPFELLTLLLLGWLNYLREVLPRTSFDPEIAFNAVVALGLGLFGLHRILCWWASRREGPSRPWRFGWTAKISLMVLLLFATSIAAVGIVHQIAWLCREPKVIVMTGIGWQTRELSDLKQVATGCRLYALDHEGRFPERVGELFPDYLPDHRIFFTRTRDGDPPQPILYFPGYKDGGDQQTLVAASPRPFASRQGSSRVVVLADGTATVIPESKFQEVMLQPKPPVYRP